MVLVSDDASFVDEIRAALAGVAEGDDLCVLANEEEALELIEREKTEVVFARLGAGPMASTFFLNEVWKRNPKSARFLVDAVSDSEALVRCVLGGHYFLQTPLDNGVVKESLDRADSMRRFLRNEKIQSLISRMRTLPPRPSIYMEVLREVRSPRASATVVGELVARDLAVGTKLIQVVNSPYYAVDQPISDVKEAVLYLGLETTVSIVCSIETFARFDKIKPLYFSVDRVWKHSQVVADLAKKICLLMNGSLEMAAQTYLAALLHDVGELALAENFGEEYEQAFKRAGKTGKLSWEVEFEIFGATHADAGAYLLALWGVPLPVVEAVAYHHLAPGVLGSSFCPAVAVHLAEKVLECSDPLEEIIARYPPEIGLRDRLEDISQLLQGVSRKARPMAAEAEAASGSKRGENDPQPKPSAPPQGRLAKLFGWRHQPASPASN